MAGRPVITAGSTETTLKIRDVMFLYIRRQRFFDVPKNVGGAPVGFGFYNCGRLSMLIQCAIRRGHLTPGLIGRQGMPDPETGTPGASGRAL